MIAPMSSANKTLECLDLQHNHHEKAALSFLNMPPHLAAPGHPLVVPLELTLTQPVKGACHIYDLHDLQPFLGCP